MAANKISKNSIAVLAGASKMVAIDYSGGDVPLAEVSRGLGANADGTVVMTLEDAPTTNVTRVVKAGTDYAWRVHTIRNSGTTAALGLYALY
ncbi:hypothetical protein [Rhizobium sp. BK251]|uniref:spike base protein, RCAP_Rcc01079 family n=1 Tax=Rhizobium sp. BK251 TaxID=2512125 RepID=UPI001042C7E2|nr:hypothetical protein [Rhizobium sp. BK251]TCL70634.1 hypothetical protein EV286_107512 [Rhizobium sp. BK251]